jgi:twinkle protein
MTSVTLKGMERVTGDAAVIAFTAKDAAALTRAKVPNVIWLVATKPDDDMSEHDAGLLAKMKRVTFAPAANDHKNLELWEGRIGKHLCWRPRWPDGGDVPCQSAEEVFEVHGAETLAECIGNADPSPVQGLNAPLDYASEVFDLYERGKPLSYSTGIRALDEYMKIVPGELSVWTGWPGSGKSEFVDQVMVNLAEAQGWRFVLASFENPPRLHLAKIAEKRLRKPFFDGPTPRMSRAELQKALDWANRAFSVYRDPTAATTIDNILNLARIDILRSGARGLVVDPWNWVESRRPQGMTETEYVSGALSRVKAFAENHNVHVFMVAHPAKMARIEGNLPIPALTDIAGSAAWAAKADLGVTVYRHEAPGDTEILIRKVRFRWNGKLGSARVRYDSPTGCYGEALHNQQQRVDLDG